MVENLVNCLENASHIHYSTSLILIKLLPANVIHEHLLTKFESTSFAIKGEIHYQKLKVKMEIIYVYNLHILHIILHLFILVDFISHLHSDTIRNVTFNSYCI